MRLLAWSTGYSVKQVPNLLRHLCFFGEKCIILLIGELYQIILNYIGLYYFISTHAVLYIVKVECLSGNDKRIFGR